MFSLLGMSWTERARGPLAALAVCVLLPLGAAGCAGGAGHGSAVSPSPAGTVLHDTDETGRQLREAAGKNAPEVGVEVTPDAAGGGDVRLTFRHFAAPSTVRPRRR